MDGRWTVLILILAALAVLGYLIANVTVWLPRNWKSNFIYRSFVGACLVAAAAGILGCFIWYENCYLHDLCFK
jgi:hypothetical protein